MPNKSSSEKSSIKTLSVQVKRITPGGLIVSLPNNEEGIIREREITWDAKKRMVWPHLYKVGENLQAISLGKRSKEYLELSIRHAQSGTWSNIEKRYQIGACVTGEVTGIMSYGVFVELEAGVSGLLHVSKFPKWVHKIPGNLFWPGDLVKVIISSVDIECQRIELSMVDLMTERWGKPESFPQNNLYSTTKIEKKNPHSSNSESFVCLCTYICLSG